MNRNIIIVLAGGLIVAVLVAVLVQAGLSGNKKVAVQEEPKSMIAVASVALKTGDELNDTNMRWQTWPQNAVLPGAVIQKENKKPSEMISGRLRRDVAEGEPVVTSAIVDLGKGNFLAASLGEGMRAVGVNVKAASMVGGFVAPGDRVDVILTYKNKISFKSSTTSEQSKIDNLIGKTISSLASETILQNIRVLAVDQEAKKADEKVKVAKTVTLEVDRLGAEKLALAGQMGDLTLALRRLGDDNIAENKGPVVTDRNMTSIFQEIYEQVAQKGTGQNENVVRIYTGGTVQQILVGQ